MLIDKTSSTKVRFRLDKIIDARRQKQEINLYTAVIRRVVSSRDENASSKWIPRRRETPVQSYGAKITSFESNQH